MIDNLPPDQDFPDEDLGREGENDGQDVGGPRHHQPRPLPPERVLPVDIVHDRQSFVTGAESV
jgi:hypothetical protein